MSVDLQILIDKHISKQEIESIVLSMGYSKAEHENTYFWCDNDFVSVRGCWFGFDYDREVFYDGDEKVVKTVCVTTTNASRSYYDFQMQLDTIKKIEEIFGGVVYTDGERGYFENDLPRLSRTEVACGYVYGTFETNLAMVERLIEEVDMDKLLTCQELGIPPIFEKNFLRNSTLLPFMVSIMEDFLRTFLHNYLYTNEEVESLIFKDNNKEKLPYSVVRELLNKEKTIVEVEMEKYSFQSLNSANKAYTKFTGIDLFKDIFSSQIIIDNKEMKMTSILSELLAKRHKLIHEAELDYSLDKKQMDKYHNCLKVLGDMFVKVFEEKQNLRIDLDNLL